MMSPTIRNSLKYHIQPPGFFYIDLSFSLHIIYI